MDILAVEHFTKRCSSFWHLRSLPRCRGATLDHWADRCAGAERGETERHRSGLVTPWRHCQAREVSEHSTAHEKDARASEPGAAGAPARSPGGTWHRGPSVPSAPQHPQGGLQCHPPAAGCERGGLAAPHTPGKRNGAPGEDGSGGLQGHCGSGRAPPAAPPPRAGMRRLGGRPRPREPEAHRPRLSRRLPPPIASAPGPLRALPRGRSRPPELLGAEG